MGPAVEGSEDPGTELQILGNIGPRKNERLPWNGYDALIRPTGRAGWQLAFDCGGDISPNNGEVAVFKLEDVRASRQPWGLVAARVRVRTDSLDEVHGNNT